MGGNFNSNPAQGALFTGAGTPWGGMQSADPGDMPGVPKDRNIDEFSAYDQSEMVKRLIAGLRGAGSKEVMGAMRQASRMGAGQSDAARAGIRDINASTEDRSRGIELQAAKDAWDSKMQQKQFAENMDMARYTQAISQWQAKKQLEEAEKAKRAAGLTGMLSMGGSTAWDKIGGLIPKGK